MRRKLLFAGLMVGAVAVVAMPASAASFFLSNATTPGSVTQNETESIDISGGGTGLMFGVWAIPDASQTLNGIDLNLRVDELSGNAIDITGAVIENPTIGAGPARRWFDDGVNSGAGIPIITPDFVSNLIGGTTSGTGAAGEGTGLADANGATDPLFDVGSGAYLFATITYDVVSVSGSADLYLQIGAAGVSDTSGLVTSVIFGLADPALNAANLVERGVDSATEDAATVGLSFWAADFDQDLDVDGSDFLTWQRGFGTLFPNGTNAIGDANFDQIVDGIDLGIWETQFSNTGVPPLVASVTAIPEPATWSLLASLLVVSGLSRFGRSGVKAAGGTNLPA